MKLQILSDLHFEFEHKYKGYKTDADIIILAGDINIHEHILTSLKHVRDIYNKPVIFVPGNHEYYHTSKHEQDEKFSEFKENDIYILNNDWLKIDDVVFIGSTGWWDESNGIVYPYVRNMSDYSLIYDLVHNNNGINWGVKSYKFFKEALEQFRNEKVVCISHNGVIDLPNEKFKGSALNTCFFNNWVDLIEEYKPQYWIHGHTHDSIDKTVFDTRIICNPKGYFDENPNFKPQLTIEV